jgi:hypothetical protein
MLPEVAEGLLHGEKTSFGMLKRMRRIRRARPFRLRGASGFFDSAAPVQGWAANLLSRAGMGDGVGLRWKASRGVPDAVLQ